MSWYLFAGAARDQRLDDAVLANGFHQLAQLFVPKFAAGLQRAGHNLGQGDLQDPIARLQGGAGAGDRLGIKDPSPRPRTFFAIESASIAPAATAQRRHHGFVAGPYFR